MSDATDLGRLLTFALDVSAIPGESGERAEYRRLTTRYRTDPAFRQIVDDLLEGADCEVTDASDRVGLIVHALPGSAWAWPPKATDLPWNQGFDKPYEKALRLYVIVALLARPFPTGIDIESALDDESFTPAPVSVMELERFIRSFCEQERDNNPPLPASMPEDQRPLWWWWCHLNAVRPTDARISRGTTGYIIFHTLQLLAEVGLLIDMAPSAGAGRKQYRFKRRLLLQYRDFLLDPLFAALREHRGPDADSSEVG
jgi:hypothetical protein